MKNVMFVLLFIGTWVTCGISVAAVAATDDSSVAVMGVSEPLSTEEQEKADVEARLKAVETCVVCHGVDGNSTKMKYPKLAAQHSAVLGKQIFNFSVGLREDRTGECTANTLDHTDKQHTFKISTYFSSQERTAEKVKFDSKLIEKGKKIYQRKDGGIDSCLNCHGSKAEGSSGTWNIHYLRAQHKGYLANQIKAIRDRKRTTDWDGMMAVNITNLSDDEIEAVATYLASLKPDTGLEANILSNPKTIPTKSKGNKAENVDVTGSK